MTAVVATLVGGWVLDRVGSSIKNAMLMNGTFMRLVWPASCTCCHKFLTSVVTNLLHLSQPASCICCSVQFSVVVTKSTEL